MKKIKSELYLPLSVARAANSLGIFEDNFSEKYLEILGVEPADIPAIKGICLGIKTKLFDERIRDYLDKNPNGTVMLFNVGVDDRAARIDNGQAHIIEVLSPKFSCLQTVLPKGERVERVVSKVLENKWLNAVTDKVSDLLIVFEGVFDELRWEEVLSVLISIRHSFKSATVVFDANSKHAGSFIKAKWGLDDTAEIPSKIEGLEFVSKHEVENDANIGLLKGVAKLWYGISMGMEMSNYGKSLYVYNFLAKN